MKRSFTHGITAVASSLILSTALAAQQPPGANSLAEGAWALQFGIGDNLTLHGFEGTTVSAKHHSSAAHALRFGVSISAGYQNGRDETRSTTDVAVGLVAHFLHYPTLGRDRGGALQMYWGLGPLLDVNLHRAPDSDGESVTERSVSVGAGGTIGAEWFVRPRISLSAEYQTGLTATFSSGSDSAPDDWGLQLGQRGVLFGVSAYFP